MSARFTFLSALLLLPLSTRAADLPKQGKNSYTTTYVNSSTRELKAGNRMVLNYDTSGITRNDKGGVMFNDMGARCLGTVDTIGNEASNRGTCVETDKDGDEIYTTYEAKGSTGTHAYVGGSGKYTGISGTASFIITPIKSPDGRGMVIVTHQADWKLP